MLMYINTYFDFVHCKQILKIQFAHWYTEFSKPSKVKVLFEDRNFILGKERRTKIISNIHMPTSEKQNWRYVFHEHVWWIGSLKKQGVSVVGLKLLGSGFKTPDQK